MYYIYIYSNVLEVNDVDLQVLKLVEDIGSVMFAIC
jgi:hypothetical protein